MAAILCFGDSITLGLVDLEGGWTQRLRRRLDQEATFPLGDTRFPAHAVYSLGVPDDTSEGWRPGWSRSWNHGGWAARRSWSSPTGQRDRLRPPGPAGRPTTPSGSRPP